MLAIDSTSSADGRELFSIVRRRSISLLKETWDVFLVKVSGWCCAKFDFYICLDKATFGAWLFLFGRGGTLLALIKLLAPISLFVYIYEYFIRIENLAQNLFKISSIFCEETIWATTCWVCTGLPDLFNIKRIIFPSQTSLLSITKSYLDSRVRYSKFKCWKSFYLLLFFKIPAHFNLIR